MSGRHKPACPKCRDTVRIRSLSGGLFYCPACDAQFDKTPNEGGDYYTDPVKRIEREERLREMGIRQRRPKPPPRKHLKGGLG